MKPYLVYVFKCCPVIGPEGAKLDQMRQHGQPRLNGVRRSQLGPSMAKWGNHPWVSGGPSLGWQVTLLGMVGDHSWQLSLGVKL